MDLPAITSAGLGTMFQSLFMTFVGRKNLLAPLDSDVNDDDADSVAAPTTVVSDDDMGEPQPSVSGAPSAADLKVRPNETPSLAARALVEGVLGCSLDGLTCQGVSDDSGAAVAVFKGDGHSCNSLKRTNESLGAAGVPIGEGVLAQAKCSVHPVMRATGPSAQTMFSCIYEFVIPS